MPHRGVVKVNEAMYHRAQYKKKDILFSKCLKKMSIPSFPGSDFKSGIKSDTHKY